MFVGGDEIVPQRAGRVDGIAIRTAKEGPMRELLVAHAVAGHGLEEDKVPVKPDRGITFLSGEKWAEVCVALGFHIPWHTRRANVLTEGLDLATLIGRSIHIGEVEVAIIGETKPCALMDKIQAGLRNALTPECRAGVHGRVIHGGALRVGDAIRVQR